MNDFPSISLLGTKLSTLNREELLAAVRQLARSRRKALVLSGNVHSFNLAYENPWFKNLLNRADIVRLDGAGLRLGAMILGHRTPPRNTWADFGPALAKTCDEAGLKLFFLGGCEGRARRAAEELQLQNPGLCVTGTAHGFFDLQPESDENREIISAINLAKPDVLIVGIGMPRQEQWIVDNLDRLDVPVIMTGGAVFDYCSGAVPRAPRWMRCVGQEWMFRLLQEPRRLWKRYLLGNPKFMWRILQERLLTIFGFHPVQPVGPETTKNCDSIPTEGNPPVVQIMGIPVTCFTVESLHRHLTALIHEGQNAIIANVNIHALNLAHEQPWFRDFLCHAESVFCDGGGVVLAARMCGQRALRDRITYADWMPLLAELCQEQGFSLYLLGAKPGVAQEAARQLALQCPKLRIAGVQHGYFDRSPAGGENERVISDINASGANILIVSFGMPLQEKWLMDNWDALRVNVALTAGGALDYASGTLRRPPRWMTANGLEWLGRFVVEPRRLWRRYFIGNPLFALRISKAMVKEAWNRRQNSFHDHLTGRGRGH